MKNILYILFLLALFVPFTFSQETQTTEDDDKKQKTAKRKLEDIAPPPIPGTRTTDDSVKENKNLNYENFKLIQLGMTYEQVKDILGSKGEQTSNSKSGNFQSKSYEWRDKEYARVSVRFQKGLLVTKSQSNLTDKIGDVKLDRSMFDQMQTGMSLEAISAIIGVDGEMTRISKIGDSIITSYTWKGPKFERIFASFRDNQLKNKTQSGLRFKSLFSLSYEKFSQIKLGMGYYDVIQIIGKEGEETSSTISSSYESNAYQWKGDKFARISVRFRNGGLVTKSQSNLTDRKGTAVLTQNKYDKVKIGMSYEEVKTALGSKGELTRVSKIGDIILKSYTWKGPNFQRIFTSFKDDKLTNKTQSGLK